MGLQEFQDGIRHFAGGDGPDGCDDWLRERDDAQRHVDQQRSVPGDPVGVYLLFEVWGVKIEEIWIILHGCDSLGG